MAEVGELPLGAVLAGAGPGWCIATWRNVMLIYAGGHIDGAFLDAALAGHDAALQFDPSGYGVVSITDRTAKLPPSDIRKRAAELRRQTQHLLRAQAAVVAGEGFFASAMRSVLTGIFSLAESRVPLSFVGTEAEAARFVVPRVCSPDADPSHVVEVLLAMRWTAR